MAEEETAVGVPLIAPVEESKDKPAGRDGETDHEVTVPPVIDGVTVVIAVPMDNVNDLGLKAKEDGVISLTTMVTVAVSLPPLLVAVMV